MSRCILQVNLKEDIVTNFIENLYYGNIEPMEIQTNITPELKAKLKVLSEKEEKFRKGLSEENLKLFDELAQFSAGFNSLSCLDSFISGFKIGGKMIYNTFID